MPDVDLIDVCTPPGLHFEQTLAALKAGKHAVCEKPLVGSLSEVDALMAHSGAAAGLLFDSGHCRFACFANDRQNAARA